MKVLNERGFDMSKTLKLTISGALLLLLAIVLTIALKTIDVQAIGPLDSKVGLAGINSAVEKAVGYQQNWYFVSETLGYITIIIVVMFFVYALVPVAKSRTFSAVVRRFWFLLAFYVVVAVVYVMFELITINYRPVLVDGELEGSFPSTHTMFAICILAGAIGEFFDGVWLPSNRRVAIFTCAVLMAAIIVGRFLSGVHWFTDIIGGALYGCSLVCFYYALKFRFRSLSEKFDE